MCMHLHCVILRNFGEKRHPFSGGIGIDLFLLVHCVCLPFVVVRSIN